MDKARQLLQELDVIEKKSEAMRRETERLRQLKNEAKATLASRHPDLFANNVPTNTNFRTADFSSEYLIYQASKKEEFSRKEKSLILPFVLENVSITR